MPINFLQMPEYKMPGALDFKPLADAVGDIGQNRLLSRKLDIAQQGQDTDKQRFGLEAGKWDAAKKLAETNRMGQQALAIDQLPDGPERRTAYNRFLSTHPNAANLPAAYRDHRLGPKMIAAEAGQMRDVLGDEMKRAQMGHVQAQTVEAHAKAKALGEKSETDSAIGAMIRGSLPSQPATSQQPLLQPQSFNDTRSGALRQDVSDTPRNRLMSDPNVVLAQSIVSPRVPATSPREPEMADTPLGPMERDNARRLGFGLSMAGKGDAGKMMMDSTTVDSMGKKTRDEVDERSLNAVESMARLDNIVASYKPEYLTVQEQLKQLGLYGKGKFGGKLTPEQEAARKGYTGLVSNTEKNLNLYIKEITGAAMGVQEAKRIESSIAHLGDDPAAFESKVGEIYKETKMSMARYNYLRAQGFKGDANAAAKMVPLERMPILYNERGNEIKKQIRDSAPQTDPNEIKARAQRQLKQEFGI